LQWQTFDGRGVVAVDHELYYFPAGGSEGAQQALYNLGLWFYGEVGGWVVALQVGPEVGGVREVEHQLFPLLLV
jgi:hypothetical protein